MLHALRVISVLFAALALVPAGSHLFSMLSKLKLDGDAYLAAQRAYDGWSLFGIVIIGALASSMALTIVLYRSGEGYLPEAFAFLCLAATQVIFWTFTFPVNQATANWTTLPPRWELLRMQWELSHAGSAALNFLALLVLVLAATRA